jgi:hypothetical protein
MPGCSITSTSWTGKLCDALNSGELPPGHFALVDQHLHGPIADVLAFERSADPEAPGGGTRSEADIYANRANRVIVRHRHGEVLAVIEIVSPGNKNSRDALRAFVEKSADLLRQGVHLLVIDLFPPSKRDPQGIHKAIWDEIEEQEFTLPPDKPLTVAAYDAGPAERVAYVEPVAVGDELPSLPIFLTPQTYVPAPLEATYRATWDLFPLKHLLERPATES